MLTLHQISNSVSRVADEYPIKRVDLFGSYAGGAPTEDSDVDLLIEFTPKAVSLLTLSGVKLRLEELLGVEVDVIRGPIPENAMITVEKAVRVYGA